MRSWLLATQAVSEVGSGLNGRRPQLIKLLANPEIQAIVVEHRDRLMRFGAEYVEAALTAQGRKLLVMESSEVKDDLVQDMLEVLICDLIWLLWFCLGYRCSVMVAPPTR